MKRIITAILIFAAALSAAAQTAEKYKQRYDLLVSQFGLSGVGVETVLSNWEKVDSTSADFLFAKFGFYFTKAQSTQVVTKDEKKYLGMDPMLSLTDSLGKETNYYQITVFDDELYGNSIKALDKAIAYHPDRLDFRFIKANAYIAYEKESPDMALPYVLDLAGRGSERNWIYEGERVDKNFFADAMQEYCYSFYSIGSKPAMDAFRSLSERLASIYPDNLDFTNNIGSYYMLAKEDYKTAIKFYNKVLKKDPANYTAIKNCVLASRKMGNVKSEKKYLEMLAAYGPENEKLLAQNRLKQLNAK